MMSVEQKGDRTLEIRVDAKVVSITCDPNVFAYLIRIAKNNGVREMVAEARTNGLSVTESWAN